MTAPPHPTPTEMEIEMAREALFIADKEDFDAGYYIVPDHETQLKRVAEALSLHAKQAREEAYEKAAKVANSFTYEQGSTKWIHGSDIAEAILKLKESK